MKNVLHSLLPFVYRIKGPAANSASRVKRSIKRHVRYRSVIGRIFNRPYHHRLSLRILPIAFPVETIATLHTLAR